MRPSPSESALIERLVLILKLCEKGGLPGRDIDLGDMETLGVYLLVLKANRIDREVLNAATADILSERFFPTPGAIAERCRPHREAIEARRNVFAGWIDCLDPRGGEMIAPPADVRDGRYVPGLGNGMASVRELSAVGDGRLREFLEGRSLAPVIGPERELELIEEARRVAGQRRN